MTPNPLLGVFFHWLGGLASASFYVPYRGVRHWAWETYWLAGGIFSWVIAPWILAFTMTSSLMAVLHEAPASSLFWAYTFGALWGLGGLTFGLTMRYLGMSLGMAVALGYTAAFGTLLPPIFRGVFATEVLGTVSGQRHPGGRGHLPARHRLRRRGGRFQRARDVRGKKARGYQGIQPQARPPGGHFFGHHELLLRLRPAPPAIPSKR